MGRGPAPSHDHCRDRRLRPMTTRTARAVFGASLALLCVATAWALPASGDERMDLVGEQVRSDPDPWAREVWPSPGGGAATPEQRPPEQTGPGQERPERAAPGHAQPEEPAPPRPGVPTALYVPAIGVAASVVPTGLADDRSMEVPPVDQAGWYRHGARPGAGAGSPVIAAHVDYDGRPGAFLRLAELELGELVTVVDDTGAVREYRVSERYQVGKGELPTDELFRRGGPPVLTLITCGGGFEEDRRRYTDNIVVRATPVT